MFGFLMGFFCLALLLAVVRGGPRRSRADGCGAGWHRGGLQGGERRFERRGARALGFVFDRLETTPGQEKEIRSAIDELLGKARELQREGRRSRGDVARLLRTDSLDETILAELFSRHDERLRDAQRAFADALGRVHLSLDPEQRERLASLLDSDRHSPSFGGPYRGWT